MAWINENDSARNVDDLKSSDSVLEQRIPDVEVLDSRIASGLKK